MSHFVVRQKQATQHPNGNRRIGSKRAGARRRFAEELPPVTETEMQSQRSLFERHDAAIWTVRLPLSPSVNNYRVVFRGRLITSVEGREYQESIKRLWFSKWNGWPPDPLTGRLRLLVAVAFRSSPPPDLDNRIKPLQDALVDAGAFLDDNQIDDLRVIRIPGVHKPGWMDVTIETISER